MERPIDPRSETWTLIEQRLNQRLDSLRKKNDAPLSETETATLRGQIAEVKNLLTLANPAPANIVDE